MLPNQSYMKRTRIESKHIRAAARGEDCCMQILGACNSDPSTVVLAHLPDESNGMGRKSDDASAAFACDTCHGVTDGRLPWPGDEQRHRDWYFRRAQTRTLRRLVELGVVSIKGVTV